jgi:CTP:molybdopterin cytidylyltransferase MocA
MAATARAPEGVGIVLAGGASTRMGGGDKCLLPLGGRPLLARIIERLRPQIGALVINANGDAARFAQFGLPSRIRSADFRDLSRACMQELPGRARIGPMRAS